MPGLVAFNRRWEVGSDDLVYPGLFELITRLIWFTAIAAVYGTYQDHLRECEKGSLVEAYYIGILTILSLQSCSSFLIICISKRGTPTMQYPRRRLPALLYIKTALFLPELAWTILGTYWAFDSSTDCDTSVVLMVKVAVIAGWILFLFLIVGILIIFDPLGSRQNMLQAGEEAKMAASKKLWETRCKVICCCAAQDENSRNAFSDIAELLTDFFKGLDLVPTDIAAGLILAQLEQQGKPARHDFVPWQETPRSASAASGMTASVTEATAENIIDIEEPKHQHGPENGATLDSMVQYPRPAPWMNIALAAHYMKFASASYGWPLFVYSNLLTGACQLCDNCRCCSCFRSQVNIAGDNCCRCNTAAILKITGVDEEDIIYASYCNRIYEIPFFVALDHKHQSVVVALRGTLSLRDALTDLTAGVETLHVADRGAGEAHKGILQAARYVQHTLESLDLLRMAEQRGPNYRLVITGHSLGAGAAAILSVLLKPQYPDLQCFAFSPPGGLLSKDLAEYTEDFVCSVVVGKDLVPRLGLATMDALKVQILESIRDCHMPKYKVLASGAWYLLCGLPDIETEDETTSTQTHLLSGPSTAQYSTVLQQQHSHEQLNEAISSHSSRRVDCPPLYMPGHVLFIDEDEPATGCYTMPLYESSWAKASIFDEIIVSPKMVSDHMPDTVLKALEQLAEKNSPPRYVLRAHRSNTDAGR